MAWSVSDFLDRLIALVKGKNTDYEPYIQNLMDWNWEAISEAIDEELIGNTELIDFSSGSQASGFIVETDGAGGWTYIATPGSSGGIAPASSPYLVMSLDAALTAERVLYPTVTDFSFHDGGPNNNATLSLVDTGVVAGSYTYGSFTVDSRGRLTAASSGTTPDLFQSDIGTLVQAWDADLDTYVSAPLTAAELGELQNIGATTISAAQWGYLGGLSGPPLESSDVGSTVQAWDSDLDDIAALSPSIGDLIRWSGASWVVYADSNYAPASSLGDYVKRDGTTALTGNWNVGGFDITSVGDLGVTTRADLATTVFTANSIGMVGAGASQGLLMYYDTDSSTDIWSTLYVSSGSGEWTVGNPAGGVIMEFNPRPDNGVLGSLGTNVAHFRAFRDTATVGGAYFTWHKGDGTSSSPHRLYGHGGDSWLAANWTTDAEGLSVGSAGHTAGYVLDIWDDTLIQGDLHVTDQVIAGGSTPTPWAASVEADALETEVGAVIGGGGDIASLSQPGTEGINLIMGYRGTGLYAHWIGTIHSSTASEDNQIRMGLWDFENAANNDELANDWHFLLNAHGQLGIGISPDPETALGTGQAGIYTDGNIKADGAIYQGSYVVLDTDDTATTSTADAVVQADGSGVIDDDWLSSAIPRTYTSTSDPDKSDDTSSGYNIGDVWVNTTRKRLHTCVDNSSGAAIWECRGPACERTQSVDQALTDPDFCEFNNSVNMPSGFTFTASAPNFYFTLADDGVYEISGTTAVEFSSVASRSNVDSWVEVDTSGVGSAYARLTGTLSKMYQRGYAENGASGSFHRYEVDLPAGTLVRVYYDRNAGSSVNKIPADGASIIIRKVRSRP